MTGGVFITLEGGEGSGKSSVAARLGADLAASGLSVVVTREPGDSPIGADVRNVLLRSRSDFTLDVRAEALLMAADRAQHVTSVVEPALLRGDVVVCDRFFDSSVAYQGFGRRLDPDWLYEVSLWAARGIVPQLTVLLDVSPTVGLSRRNVAGSVNRLDLEDVSFHQRVRDGFLWCAERDAERFRVVDANRDDVDVVYGDVWSEVAGFLALRGLVAAAG